MREREREALRWAILASLFLHALMFGAMPGWREAQRWTAPPQIHARLDGTERVDPDTAETPRERIDTPKARRPELSRPRAARTIEPAAAPIEPMAPASGSEAAPATARRELDGGTLGQYRFAVMLRARNAMRYPALAVENRWQGRVVLWLQVGANGIVHSVDVRVSSGHAVLDAAAAEMAAFGASQVPPPQSLRGREFGVELPVVFNLP